MEVTVRGVTYQVEQFREAKEQAIVLLHGFTGSTKTWHELAGQLKDKRVVLIDLLGHGATAIPEDTSRYAMEQQVEDLHELFAALGLDSFILLGYSMGGRVALAYANAYPEKIKALILESASPGLETAEEQLERRERDSALAQKIVQNGMESFVNSWEAIPLFASQKLLPAVVRERVRSERLAQSPEGLAGSLNGMGTGAQQSYWEQLEVLEVPVLLVTGCLDEKFIAIGRRMAERIKRAQHVTLHAGHAIHVEKPVEFATIIKKYISSLE